MPQISLQVALTESVFTALDARLEELAGVRAQREAQLAELRDKLASMWESVEISPTDENRRFFERALESPARLHASTHDKVRPALSLCAHKPPLSSCTERRLQTTYC